MKMKTNMASADLENKKKRRNELTAESRLKNDEVQNLKTTMNKNIENLQLYESYMKFLLDVADKTVKEKFERVREDKRQAKWEEAHVLKERKGRSNERR